MNSPAISTMPTSVTRVTVASAASRPILPWVTPEKKKQGPLTRADERALTVSERRLTRAVTEEENMQEFEFDKEMFTFRELSVYLMTMHAWGAATLACKGHWQKLCSILQLASVLGKIDQSDILYDKNWRNTGTVTLGGATRLRSHSLRRRYKALHNNRHRVHQLLGKQIHIKENKKKMIS
jgi:hypothetical protein